MKIVYSPYQMKKKVKLNSQPQSALQSGMLLKIIEGDKWGVADLCLNPELGDGSVENEINSSGPLFTRAVELAQEDLNARKAKKSLLVNKHIKNNFLLTNYKNADLNQALYLNQTVKIKADRDVRSLSELLNGLKTKVKIRIDFNSVLSSAEFEEFLKLLSLETLRKIEYIEDPTVFSEKWSKKWKEWNSVVPLAFDFQRAEYSPEFAKYQIIKPTRQKLGAATKDFTLTSAMGHAVGVAHGLRIAQQQAQNDSGFLTLDVFETGNFNKYFEQKDNYLNFSALALASALDDFGIGMRQELDKMQWLEL